MEDYLVRILAKEAGVRGLACVTTNLVNEASGRHGASPTAAAVLGRALTGAALMGALLKVQQRVALKFEGSGPVAKVLVESDSYGKVRGYVAEPAVELPKAGDEYDVVSAIGRAGLLTVVKDLRLKNLYESVVPLAASDIDTDLTVYLERSEQIPSAVEVGVMVEEEGTVAVAGGLLIQSMPPHDAAIVEQLKDRVQELPPVEELLNSGQRPADVLALVFDGIDYEFLEKRPLQFKCGCSRARSEQALVMLGREEIEMLLETEGQAVVDCHFCHERYVFTGEELEMLLEEL